MSATIISEESILSQDFLRHLFDAVLIVRNGRVTWANDSAKKLLGMADNVVGAALNQLSPEAEGILSSQNPARYHFWRQRIDPATNISRRDLFIADTRWIPDASAGVSGQLVFRDASDLAIVEKRLINTAFKDDRSGLLTQVGFVDLADTTFSRARKGDQLSMVIAMYIPDLTDYEIDPVIHSELIRDIAVRICYALRGNDLASYLGQSEFAVMLHNVAKLEQALAVIKRIAARVSAPFECKGKQVRLRALLGVSIHGVDGQAARSLLEAAARASAEGELEDARTYFAITFVNKEIQKILQQDMARVEFLRQEVVQGRIGFQHTFYQGEEGRACLIVPALTGYSEAEIWQMHEAEDQAQQLVQRAIASCASIASDFYVVSYPERHSRIGNNAMALFCAEHSMELFRFYSCHPDAVAGGEKQGARVAACWNGTVSLFSLKTSGVALLLVTGDAAHPLIVGEVALAKQFFKVFTSA